LTFSLKPVPAFEACPECDLLLNPAQPEPGDKAHCPRCRFLIFKPHKHSIERTLALSIAGLILFFPANLLPMIGAKLLGNSLEENLWSGILALFEEDLWMVALLVLLSSVLLPFINMSLAFMISLHLFIKKPNKHLKFWMRWYQHLNEWAMLEVYALGIIVAWVKLSGDADLKLGLGLYAFIGLLIINTMLTNELDYYSFWQRIGQLAKKQE
jgi:paraquat-inducible protein A